MELEAIRDRMGLLIDRIMSEAGLYAPEYAALALKQCEGSPEEAVFLLRAYRSTLIRTHVSRVVSGDRMHIRRRISSAFKDIPGGQLLGPIYDYVHRLLDFDLAEETEQELQERCRQFEEQIVQSEEPQVLSDTAPRVLDLLREEGLIAAMEPDDSEPCDITMENCRRCGAENVYFDEIYDAQTGEHFCQCSDTGYCVNRRAAQAAKQSAASDAQKE